MRQFEVSSGSIITTFVFFLLLESSSSTSVQDLWLKKSSLQERDFPRGGEVNDWMRVLKDDRLLRREEEESEDHRWWESGTHLGTSPNAERGGGVDYSSRNNMLRKRTDGRFFNSAMKNNLFSVPQDFRKDLSRSPMILRGQVPSLSISNNIDVLRNQLRKQVNLRMRNKSRNQVILQNSNLLQDIGRRRRR